ncbi:Clavaminate synthase-like protein [Rhodofomes roseus]|uniref:Clavaminate synthase-like protein n=1 Tax=Rhodofomes roseus TaxID=34475 RepID=A0ABQ8KJ12_9APHY|nr:Clavaminate synthase-like protein [Rhodofomes roseus]KAH9837958.1 Clavaminate synthase-like protein [Rhodofomes roseus]
MFSKTFSRSFRQSTTGRHVFRRRIASQHTDAADVTLKEHCVQAAPVPPLTIDIDSPQEFLRHATSSDSIPLHIHRPSSTGKSRAHELLRRLREAEDRIIDVELGRYDDATAGSFEHISLPLGQYLNWIESDQSNGGKVAGRQLYLAQWRASDDIPALAQLIQPPPLLAPLLKDVPVKADLYQTSFFIGPAGAVTPLHYDPYFNLYHLYASANPERHAKHIFLLPPHASEFVKRADGQHALRNTSSIGLSLATSQNGDAFAIMAAPDTPGRSVEAMSTSGFCCILREGETLFIPKGWWHRVENVVLGHDQQPSNSGWTAGIGWWWLPRANPSRIP